MDRCDKCIFWSRRYGDDGYLDIGNCSIKLPPYIKQEYGTKTKEDEGCDLGKPDEDAAKDVL